MLQIQGHTYATFLGIDELSHHVARVRFEIWVVHNQPHPAKQSFGGVTRAGKRPDEGTAKLRQRSVESSRSASFGIEPRPVGLVDG